MISLIVSEDEKKFKNKHVLLCIYNNASKNNYCYCVLFNLRKF